MKFLKIVGIIFVIGIILSGVMAILGDDIEGISDNQEPITTTEISTTEIIQESKETTEKKDEANNLTTEEKTTKSKSTKSKPTKPVKDYNKVVFDIPSHSDGEAYVEINGNMPTFSDSDKKSVEPFEKYSELDYLGRCGVAYANICKEIMPTEERGEIGPVKPSGWHTVKYNDLIDGNYLYNRCHLIGYQLAGENANVQNLITGTRYLNVIGMLPFENMISDYVERKDNHVLYRVTPVFEKDNLVASGVQMEAWSVEDEGKGICFNVFCFNEQLGIIIDYSTGESWIDENYAYSTESSENENTQAVTSENADENTIGCYVLNTNTKKIHMLSCSSVNDMAEHNKWLFSGTLEDAEGMGYSRCKRCLGN